MMPTLGPLPLPVRCRLCGAEGYWDEDRIRWPQGECLHEPERKEDEEGREGH
jgi:hypothetical protein